MPMWKKCKNIRGLKIHQARKKCQVELSQMQCIGISPSEMREVQGQEAHHSTQSLQAETQNSPGTLKTFGKRIKWPTATDKKVWHDFDEDISEILEITSKGSVD